MKLLTLNQVVPWTDDFFFLRIGKDERLVICNPQDSICLAPTFLRSKKTLEEHIQLVNERQITTAMIVAEDISFLRQCPSLEELAVYPSFNAVDFDFSPLYDMPNLRSLTCGTIYGPNENRISNIDYSKFKNLKRLIINTPKGHHNVNMVKGLEYLALENQQPKDKSLVGCFHGESLKELVVNASSICTLEGLERAKSLCCLELSYNRSLVDVSHLMMVKDTLVRLDIENCGRIEDFSVLKELKNLRYLRMIGRNTIPDLSFIRSMPHLHSFIFTMNVTDGDLSICLPIPYVSIQNRKHYSHKDKDFSKG